MKTKQKSLAQIGKEMWRSWKPTAKDLLLLPDEKIYRRIFKLLRSKSVSDKSPDTFWPRFRFEKWLIDMSKKNEAGDESEKIVLKAIQDALTDLKNDPSLFSGDPFGDFTYDHPILAIAITRFRDCLAPQNRLLFFLSDGTLNKHAAFRWGKTAISAALTFRSSSIEKLRKRVPTKSLVEDDVIVRIAVVGDAGFPNEAQENLVRNINALHKTKPFNLFVHLGDTYFAGSYGEFLENLLQPFQALEIEKKVALCGNHDLYEGGAGFGAVLDMWRQPGRYLTVETKSWIIACLDTAHGAQDISRMNGRLDDEQFHWLERLIKNKGKKRVVLMSHHEPVSAWSKSKKKPLLLTQLEPFCSDIFAWYWGHEHVCATYPRATRGFYGACVGNGVFPEKCSEPSKITAQQAEWYSKAKCKCLPDRFPFSKIFKKPLWPHGFLELELHSDKIIETYHVEGEKYPYSRILIT